MTPRPLLLARSLAEASALAARGGPASLILSASPDLQCRNLMCEKWGFACLCRLAVCLQRCANLTSLDLSHNGLTSLPEPVLLHQSSATRLAHLDISGNALRTLPDAVLRLGTLRSLAVDGNPLTLQVHQLLALPRLQEVLLSEGQLREAQMQELAQEKPDLTVTIREAEGGADALRLRHGEAVGD